MPIGNFYNERKMIRHFISQGKRNARRWILTLTVCLSVFAGASGGSAQEASPVFLQMIKSQHRRLVLPEKVRRLAVGDNAIVSAELLTERELLLFGLNTGRTTVLAWLESGKMRTYLCVVEPDLSILHAALHQVHPSIRVEVAPDRDAILLTGSVPDVGYSNAAEAITRDYFKAGGGQREGRAKPFVQASGKTSSSPAPESPGEESASGASAEQADGAKPSARVDAPAPPSASIINMIRLEKLPPTLEERIERAIREIGAEEVRVRRLPRGAAHNDEQDAFILEGAVPNQVALVRILNIAAHLLGGERAREGELKVVADEAGALAAAQGQTSGGGGSFGSISGGGGGGGSLANLVRKNLGRAKMIVAAQGRLLSLLRVKDLPQVRVDINLYEINRNKLRTFNADFFAGASSFNQGALNPAPNAIPFQGGDAARVGTFDRTDAQNALSFLAGSLSNTFQLQSGKFAMASLLSMLQRLNLARSLASPSLMVLSGEQAQFQVGGELPVPQAFSPALGGDGAGGGGQLPPGVFSSVIFVPFGVTVQIRPLVGEDDRITLDVIPTISTPDPQLTASVRQTTGNTVSTTAFRTRSLKTTARLEDGQVLLMAGLLSRERSEDETAPPWLSEVPGLEWLFKQSNRRDDEMELVIVVNPVILREPRTEIGQWAFPNVFEHPLGEAFIELPPVSSDEKAKERESSPARPGRF